MRCSTTQVVEFFIVSHLFFNLLRTSKQYRWLHISINSIMGSHHTNYSLSNLYFEMSVPNDRFRLSSKSSSSESDFLPKLRNLRRSVLLYCTRSPSVSTSAAFKQLSARTERFMSTSLVLSNWRMWRTRSEE